MGKIIIEFTVDELKRILASLAEKPYKQVASLIKKIEDKLRANESEKGNKE
jgi:hypothetical protein